MKEGDRMRIAVVDDERPSRSELCHLIRQLHPQIEIAEADSGCQALELAAEHSFDAMFLDIHLGDIAGVQLAGMLRKLQPQLQIVFATAYDSYALKAFDLEAVDYLMKPFDSKRVEQALLKLQIKGDKSPEVQIRQCKCPDKLSVSNGKHVVLLNISDVSYVEAVEGSCTIHSKGKKYASNQPLSYFEQRLAANQFFRIHKSYLINLADMVEYFPWNSGTFCVKMKGYEQINLPVSRKQMRILRDLFV